MVCMLAWLQTGFGLVAQEMPATPIEAIAWLEAEQNTIEKNENGEVVRIIIDYVPDVFVLGDLEIFPKLEVLKINYTGQFYDRHMSGIARLTSLKQFEVDYCEEISEASLSVLRYLPKLEEVVLKNCEAVYSLKALSDCKSLKKIDISSNEHLDFHALKSLQLLPNLETLILSENSSLEDKHLRWLTGMPSLREIRLSDCEGITDEGLVYFSDMGNLRIIDLSDNKGITGETLDSINGQSLEELYINDCSVTDEFLSKLAHLKSLKKLRLENNSGIKGEGLSVFKNFRKLEGLWLNGFGVTNEQLRAMDGIETLKTISLSGCRLVSGLGLVSLTNSKGVERLTLDGCRRIDDEDLSEICKFENLKELRLDGTKVRPEGMKRLQNLKKLELLDVSKCNWIDDQAIKTISEFPALNHLILSRVPRLTDESLAHLANSKLLTRLEIEDNLNMTSDGFSSWPEDAPLEMLTLRNLQKLSPRGLKNIGRLKSLKMLEIYQSNITNRHLEALHGAPAIERLVIESEGVNFDALGVLQNSLPRFGRGH